jgi:hypothetical protein
MKSNSESQVNEQTPSLPKGEALLVGLIALIISGTILFFAVSTSRPSEPSHSRASYDHRVEPIPTYTGSTPPPTQITQKEKLP